MKQAIKCGTFSHHKNARREGERDLQGVQILLQETWDCGGNSIITIELGKFKISIGWPPNHPMALINRASHQAVEKAVVMTINAL